MRSLSLAARLLALALATSYSAAHLHQQSFPLPIQDERITFASAQPVVSFVAQKVVRISTATSHQHQSLLQRAHQLGLDVWAAKLGAACATEHDGFGCIDVRLASDTHNEDPSRSTASISADAILADLLAPFSSGSRPQVDTLIQDLDQLISSQRTSSAGALAEASMRGPAWYTDYRTLDDINDYMRWLEQSYPSHAKVVEIGKTYEGRAILALKVSSGLPTQPQPPTQPEPQPEPPSNATSSAATVGDKLGIVITGGSHAREWISTSASLFFASDLLRAALGRPHPLPPQQPNSTLSSSVFEQDVSSSKKGRKGRKGRKKSKRTWTKQQARAILSTFEITVIPVANPDGYVYSWQKNRMWRKNRQPNRFPGGLFCKGVDLNRNYGYAFTGSSSFNPCSEMYPGSAAFSAAETRAIGEYLQDGANNVRGFFDLHSYGQLLMYPFSYSCDETVADEEDLLELSLGAISALKRVHGRQFNTGQICQVYAQGGGNAVDWSYASTEPVPTEQGDPSPGLKRKIKWSFSIELRDGGTYGFLLPPEQIVAASEEANAAIGYMLNFIAKKDSR